MKANWNELENKLISFRDIKNLINQELHLYKNEIQSLINEIYYSDYEKSLIIFNQLYEIQSNVATVYYKYNFPIEEFLEDFMFDFDRDDEYSRKYLFEKIKKSINSPYK